MSVGCVRLVSSISAIESLYLFAACRPGTDETFALALPRVNADAMTIFLEHFSRQLEPGVHAVLVLDQAGYTSFWLGADRACSMT